MVSVSTITKAAMTFNPIQNSQFFFATNAVAADGNSQATAAELDTNLANVVSGADGTKAVRLPATRSNKLCAVYNASASALPVYPHSGGDVNDGSSNAAVTIAAKSLAIFAAIDETTWAGQFTAAA